MPDHRQHRGPHPRDDDLFGEGYHAVLRVAVEHFAWLLERGYTDQAALKLVGDHFSLTVRQRQAIMRATCSDSARTLRQTRQVAPSEVQGRPLFVDGFNVLITLEAALGGALVLIGRDGVYRDLASVHGTYRAVSETPVAIQLWASATQALAPSSVHVYLDAPVSNSGRLALIMRELCPSDGWSVEVVKSPDSLLKNVSDGIVATADGIILQECTRWIDLVAWTILHHAIACWRLDLSLG